MPILLDYLGVSRNTMSLHNKSITGQDHFPQKNPTFQMILEIMISSCLSYVSRLPFGKFKTQLSHNYYHLTL